METGLKNFNDFLEKYEKIILSTHESPDADGLGSEIGMVYLLRHLGKKPVILNSDVTPEKYRFIDVDHEISVINVNFDVPNDIEDYALLVLDTNDCNNIGKAYTFLKDKVKEIFVVDHQSGDSGCYQSSFIKEQASSTSEMVYALLKHYNTPIEFKVAQALFAGVVFDTGSFRYPKTTAFTFKMASELVEIGVIPFDIFEKLYENNSLASFELRTLILSSMKVLFQGRLVVMSMTADMLLKTGAPYEEGELNINVPLTVKGVVVSVLVKEDTNGLVKVSMRSKGNYDVSKVALENGGGGHKNAAGYKSKYKFNDAYAKAIDDVSVFFQ